MQFKAASAGNVHAAECKCSCNGLRAPSRSTVEQKRRNEILPIVVDDGRKNAAHPWCLMEYQIPTRKGIRHVQQNTATDSVLTMDSSGRPAVDALTEILRHGARQMLATAIEHEVDEYIDADAGLRDADGRRLAVRTGHMPERSILTGLGPVDVMRPRVNDRRTDAEGNRIRFTSAILPPYLRRTKAIDELVPWLFLKGISLGDFPDALQALLGPGAEGLSATNICRLKRVWEDEWKDWSRRDLAGKKYVYVWADGIHFNIRLGDAADNTQCVLVLMGATADGRKELIGLADGYRESEHSWTELLAGLQSRGLAISPKVAVADGALGFWAACWKLWPRWCSVCSCRRSQRNIPKLPNAWRRTATCC